MSVQLSSRKSTSWETTTTVPCQEVRRCSPSQRTPSRSRWFVGSSRRSRRGRTCRAFASATRMRHPPESARESASCIASVKPRPARMRRASASARWAPRASSSVSRAVTRAKAPGQSKAGAGGPPLASASSALSWASRAARRSRSSMAASSRLLCARITCWYTGSPLARTSWSTSSMSRAAGTGRRRAASSLRSVVLPRPLGPNRP
mmetsp:Transcript_21233/g.71414  ORF Transcript_21233/g.71414 Transcript_21233/m.71414 type:complete len:206 (+) Transcript_21233:1154-1771(+)